MTASARYGIDRWMARLARYIVPGVPHHVTQRGNGRQQAFFGDSDYAAYRDLLATHCAVYGVAVCALR